MMSDNPRRGAGVLLRDDAAAHEALPGLDTPNRNPAK
jgi:hypothetical protein